MGAAVGLRRRAEGPPPPGVGLPPTSGGAGWPCLEAPTRSGPACGAHAVVSRRAVTAAVERLPGG